VKKSLSISIVVYESDLTVLEETVKSLVCSLMFAQKQKAITHGSLIVIDNGVSGKYFARLYEMVSLIWNKTSMPLFFIKDHGNIGYGRGHNLGIFSSSSQYHLVLNPDVVIKENALANAMLFMEKEKEVGLLVPKVMDLKGDNQHLIKRYPALLTLFIRGFLPFVKKWTFFEKSIKKRMAHHDLRERDWNTRQIIVNELVSGCFMFFRRDCLKKINGFSQAFFLYFEDYDLSLKINGVASTVYNPDVSIMHSGGNASRKGVWHILQYIRSGIIFYSKHGWNFF